MSVLNKIAYLQNRRDEVPNQELARELVGARNSAGVREIAENLWNKDQNIQSDCIKVLYEIGYQDPALIADYVSDFLKLLKSRHNRLVWGGMIALSTIGALKPDEIFQQYDEIRRVMETGSIITMDNGVKTLALVASKNVSYNREIFPFLLDHLATCRPKDVPQHAEKTLPTVNSSNKADFIKVLEKRTEDMSGSQVTRVKRVIKDAQKR